MAKCSWCGKVTTQPQLIDGADGSYKVCTACAEKFKNNQCRKCGSVVSADLLIQGMCMTCFQLQLNEKAKRQEEIASGVDRDAIDIIKSEVVFTDEDYEQWLTMGRAFSPDDMQNSRELRRLWILVKLNASGVYDGNVISDNIADIETLLDRNLQKLINRKCRIVVASNSKLRREVLQENIIDYEGQVYILEGLKG